MTPTKPLASPRPRALRLVSPCLRALAGRPSCAAAALLLAAAPGCAPSAEPGTGSAFESWTDEDATRIIAASRAEEWLRNQAYGLGLDARTGLAATRVDRDLVGTDHVRIAQSLDGLPVLGGEAIVHLDGRGDPRALTDALVRDLAVDTRPTLAAAAAEAIALDAAGELDPDLAPAVRLVVLREQDRDHLAYEVRLSFLRNAASPSVPLVYVDAHDGEVVRLIETLRHVQATGTGDHAGTVTFDAYKKSPFAVYLEDTALQQAVFDFKGGTTTGSLTSISSKKASFPNAKYGEAVDVHYAGGLYLEMLLDDFGRDGLDGAGGPTYKASATGSGNVLTLAVHYSTNYVNAFWANSPGQYALAAFGDGDGVSSNALTPMDVVGHELTHGLADFTAGFVYSYESGALDESYADVFGAVLEARTYGVSSDTWKLGEDCWTPAISGDAVRYMDDPTRDGVSRDHYASRYTGSSDNGGVHWNSGIGNVAFYLVSQGGPHPSTGGGVSGIGIDAAAATWFQSLNYLTSNATFADARDATIQAAVDLFSGCGPEEAAVWDAWNLAGVGPAWSPCPFDPGPEPGAPDAGE